MPGLEQRNTEESEQPEDDETSEKNGENNHRSGLEPLSEYLRGRIRSKCSRAKEFKEAALITKKTTDLSKTALLVRCYFESHKEKVTDYEHN